MHRGSVLLLCTITQIEFELLTISACEETSLEGIELLVYTFESGLGLGLGLGFALRALSS